MIIKIARKFSAAHKLPNYKGNCHDLHGHTWKVVFLIKGRPQKDGMIKDFRLLKRKLDEHLPDHCFLNDIITNPTAENIAEYFWKKYSAILKKDFKVDLHGIEVWESEDCAVCIEK
jgi:6-pyruvoyltetrahydropterin/6-carboxytetrahydropterin synthase